MEGLELKLDYIKKEEKKESTEKQLEYLDTRYFKISAWPHSWPSAGGFRHLIFFADKNGFNKVIKRVGRRILIDEKAFFDWMKEQK